MNRNIGALWTKVDKKGQKFLSGEITVGEKKVGILIFKNNYKEEPKHPDWVIIPAQRQEKEFDGEDIPL